jgi:hypothetical protein
MSKIIIALSTSNLESNDIQRDIRYICETHMQVANTATILNHKVGFLKTADGIIIFVLCISSGVYATLFHTDVSEYPVVRT